nr:MobP2 family relaxase [Halalkalibacterium halodurans]
MFEEYTENEDINYSEEEKVLERFSQHLEKFIDKRSESIRTMIHKKEKFLSNLENSINFAERKIKKSESVLSYDHYSDYMDNPNKTSALFTKNSDQLDTKDKKAIKRIYKEAQKNGSVMWQDVISFDNRWLEKHGIYDPETNTVDEKKIMLATRSAMNEMLKREGLQDSAIWSGAIHYNTDNIHVHIATVEPIPTRKRGKRKPKTLRYMKSKVVNQIMDRSVEQKKINTLIRDNIVKKKKSKPMKFNREAKKLFEHIKENLPSDKRQWQYGYNSLDKIRPTIDQLSKLYIMKYHRKEYNELLNRLDEEVKVMKEAYGEGNYEKLKQNKIEELYKRLGNATLKEIKELSQQEQARLKISRKGNKEPSIRRDNIKHKILVNRALFKAQNMFKREYTSWKNQQHFERLQALQAERDREYER